MRPIILILICVCFSASLWAQTEEQQQAPKFKPHYAGTSVDVGFMFMPHYGSAFYVAPKLRFQATPRLFVNTGISVVQYNLLPSQMKNEGSSLQRTATGAYIFVEGMYLLNERWSVNGSVMKDVSPSPMRRATPYSVPTEAMHFGVDYKITPNITVGARIGYSNGTRSNVHSPFYPY
jgi:hypothetical protein